MANIASERHTRLSRHPGLHILQPASRSSLPSRAAQDYSDRPRRNAPGNPEGHATVPLHQSSHPPFLPQRHALTQARSHVSPPGRRPSATAPPPIYPRPVIAMCDAPARLSLNCFPTAHPRIDIRISDRSSGTSVAFVAAGLFQWRACGLQKLQTGTLLPHCLVHDLAPYPPPSSHRRPLSRPVQRSLLCRLPGSSSNQPEIC